jgi:multiple sugar transport system ATP-binding protein
MAESLQDVVSFATARVLDMAEVEYRDATCAYESTDKPAVDALNLEIRDGEFMVLVGPSGSGKSTALRMLAGLEFIDSGTILIGGQDVADLAPKDRDIAMVFQNYALYPQMTVAENIGFSLKIHRVPKEEVRQKVLVAAKLLDLDKYLDRKPGSLSGGQRQRVAMGRAIVREPRVFLMDEPLSNLDAQLRVATRTEISSLQRRLGVTTVYVTHDQVEAMTMGDRVAVMRDGVLQQCDTPRGLFERPYNRFVAGFIGSPAMNLYEVNVSEAGAILGPLAIPMDPKQRAGVGQRVTIGVRPEGFLLTPAGSGIPAVVEVVEELGSEAFVYVSIDIEGTTKRVTVRTAPEVVPKRGERLGLETRPGSAYFFNFETGIRITA